MLNQGQRANRSGKAAEDVIAGILRQHGFDVQSQVVVGRTIYGTELRVDLLITNVVGFPRGLAIESKWQALSGSADEKLPYLAENIRSHCYPCPVIVVVHGGGCREGAFAWLKQQADGQQLIDVLRLEEFLSWVMRLSVSRPLNCLRFDSTGARSHG